MTRDEMLFQKRIEAKLRAEINARKDRGVIKAGANLPSQWGKVVNNEQRLIDNGHFMKTGAGAKIDFLREEIKKAKKLNKKVTEIVLVKR